MKTTGWFTLICILFFHVTFCQADYDYSGTLKSQKDVLKFEFTVEEEGIVTFFTSVWSENGPDLLLTVWDTFGNYLMQFDDANDMFYYESGDQPYLVGELDVFGQDLFDAGTYLATLTVGGNWTNGSHLSDGFEYDAEAPLPIELWNGTTTDSVSFHIVGASSVRLLEDQPPVVPEPATLAILGLGLAGLPLVRKHFRKFAC